MSVSLAESKNFVTEEGTLFAMITTAEPCKVEESAMLQVEQIYIQSFEEVLISRTPILNATGLYQATLRVKTTNLKNKFHIKPYEDLHPSKKDEWEILESKPFYLRKKDRVEIWASEIHSGSLEFDYLILKRVSKYSEGVKSLATDSLVKFRQFLRGR
jgi:hypothetical protein